MKTIKAISIIILVVLLFLSTGFNNVIGLESSGTLHLESGRANLNGETASTAPVLNETTHLIASGNSGITYELFLPLDKLQIEKIWVEGKPYVFISLPGFPKIDQAGAPALPFHNERLAIPFDTDFTIQVTPGKVTRQILPGQILPAETPIVNWGLPKPASEIEILPNIEYLHEEDPEVYQADLHYPGTLAMVVSDGQIRGQRIIGVNAFPLQYNPSTKELVLYESLLVEISFSGGQKSASRQIADDSIAYENFFADLLLNQESARQWRQNEDQESNPIERQSQKADLPWMPPNPGWKITVKEDGFYQINYSELKAADFPVETLDPRTIKLYHMGKEVAIHVQGEANGRFDVNDTLMFYGQAVDSKYSANNVYWLTYGGNAGRRMPSRDGTPKSTNTPSNYLATQRFEGNQFYLSLAPGDKYLDRWFWNYLYPPQIPSRSHTFMLIEPYQGGGQATLTIAMLGYRSAPQNPDHHVKVYLVNSGGKTFLGETLWDGVEWNILSLTFNTNLLKAGENRIEITAHLVAGASVDVIYIDWIELQFPNTFNADNNKLSFTYKQTGTWKYKIDGFNSDLISVFDVTDPLSVQIIKNGVTSADGSGYSIQFQDAITGATQYWTTSTTALSKVQRIEKDIGSNLQSRTNGADHIIITHPDFRNQAETLRSHRASQMRAKVVDIRDIYDEFNFGIASAYAIQDFLAYAYNQWQAPAPSYVILMGDGHYDPKNYANERTSFIPPYLAPVDPWIGETAADNGYVTITGSDTLPDMMLGRLSVNTPGEAQAFVNKIIAYEQADFENWHQHILAVADDADSGGDYPTILDNIITDLVPDTYTVDKVYHLITHTTVNETRAAIRSGFNSGKFLVSYFGHAYYTGWASEDLLTTADILTLNNGPRYPIVLAMTCYEGYFHRPRPISATSEAMAEVITSTAGKGAVASWSPTGLGIIAGHNRLTRGFYEAVFNQNTNRLGQATLAGKTNLWSSGSNLDLLDTYTLFGDPALILKTLPSELYPPSNLSTTPISTTQINLSWTDNATDETTYHIERSVDGSTGWQEIQVLPANSTSYSDSGLTPNTTYYYRVRAYRADDNIYSDYSNTAHATTGNVPALPTDLFAQAVSTNQINLSWTDNATDETTYHIERSLDGSTGWQEIQVLPANSTSFSDIGLTSGTTYHYRVRAYRADDGLYSGYSKVASATTTGLFQLFLPLLFK